MAHSSGGAALQEAISILFFTGFILFLLLLCQRGQFGSLNLSRLLNGIGLGAGRHERRKESDDVLPDTEDEGETAPLPPPPKPATGEKKREPGKTPRSSEGTEGLRERRRERPKLTKEEEDQTNRLRHEAREGEEELKTGPQKTSSETTNPEGRGEGGKQRSRRPEKVAEPEVSTTRTRTAEKTRPEPLKVRTEGLSDAEEEEKLRQREEEREVRRQREPESQDLSFRTLKRKAKERDLKRQTGVSQSIQSAPLEIRHESLAGTSKHSAPPDRSYITVDRSSHPSSKTKVNGRTRRLRHKLGEDWEDDDVIDRPDGLSRLDKPPRSAPLELKHHRLHRDGDLSAPPEGRFSHTLRDDEEVEDEERVEDSRRPELRGGELPEEMGHQSRRYTRVDKSLDSSAPSTSTSSIYPYLDDWLEKDQERVRALPQSRARRQGSKLSVDIPDRRGLERSVVVDSGTEAEDIPVGVVRAKHNRRGHRKRVSFAGTDSGEEADQENQPPSAGRKPKKNILKKDRDGDGDGGDGGGGRPPSPSGDYDNLDDFMDPKGPPPSKKDSRKPKSDGEGGKGGGGGQRQVTPTGDDDNLDDFVRPDEATTPPARESRKAKEDPKASSRTKKSKTASTPPPPEKGKKSARSGSGEESAGGGDDPRRVRIDIKTDQGNPEKKGKKGKKEAGGGGADDGGDDDQTKKKKTKKKQTGESSDEPDDGEEGDGGKKKARKDAKPTSKKPQKGKKDQAAAGDDDDDDDDPANPPVKKKKKKPPSKGDGENADDDDDDPDLKDGAKKKKKTTKQGGGKSGNDRGDDDDDDDLNDDGERRRKRRGGNGDGGDGNGRGKKGNQGRGNNNYDDDPDDDDYAGGGGGGGRARQRRRGQGGNYQNPQDPSFSQYGNPNPMYNQGQPYPGQDTQTQNGQNPGVFNNMFTRAKNGNQSQNNGGKQGDQTSQPLNNAVDGTIPDGTATDAPDEMTTAPGTGKGTKPPQVKKGQSVNDAIDADSRPTDALGGDPLDDETDSNEDDDPIGAALKKATGMGPNKDPSSKDEDPPEGDNPEDGGDGDPMGHSERTGGGGGLTKQQRDAINDAEGEESDSDGDARGDNLDELERRKVEEVDRLVRDGSADEIEQFLKQKDSSTKKADTEDKKQNTTTDMTVEKEAEHDGLNKDGDQLPDPGPERPASRSPLAQETQDDAFTPTAPAPVPSPLLEKPSTDEPTSNPGKLADKALAGSETPTPRSSKQAVVDDLPSPATPPLQQLGAKTKAGIAEVAQKHDSEVSPSRITKTSQEQGGEPFTSTEPAPLSSPTRQSPAKDAFDGSSIPLDAAPLPSPAVKKSGTSDFAQASPATRRGVNTARDQDSEAESDHSPNYGTDQLQGKTKADATQDSPSDSPDTPNYAADQLFYKTEEDKASRTAAVASPISPERTTTQSEDAATKQKQEPAKVTSPLPGLSKNDISRDKPSSEDTDSILDAYTEQDPIINNVSTGNPTLVESKDLHEPQQAVFMSADDDRRASTDSGYGTKVPSPTSPARNGASKEAERTEKMRTHSPEPEVSPLTPAVQSKTVQSPLTQQATNSPISEVSPVTASPVKQESEAPRVQQEGLGQVPKPHEVDVDDRRENEAGASQSNIRGPREQDSSESDGESAPAVASQSQKTEAQQKNKQMQEVDSEEEEEKLDRTKERVDPRTQQASGKPSQEGQKEDRESGESDGTTSPAKQADQGSREKEPETERGGAESEETDSESDFEDQDLLNRAQKGKNSQAGLIIQKALRTAGNLTEAQIKAVKGARGMLRLKPKQLEEPFILARAFKMGNPAPGPPTNWERVWRDDKGIPENMRTGGRNIPAQKTTGPRQQEHAMAHNGHGEGQMKHKEKERPKAAEQSDAETSEEEDGGVKARKAAENASKGRGNDVERQIPSTQAAGSFLHPWRLIRYTFSTVKRAPVWSAATLVSTLGYVGGAYFWYIVLNSSQSATTTSLVKREASSISNAASSVAKMGVDTQLAFTILNIYCFFGLLLLALMAHMTMGHAENPGGSQREWIKHPFQTLSKGGQTLAGSVSGILGVVFMQAGLNGPMTFWHKMGWWTAMRLGLFVLQLVLLGLSNNQVISLTYMTITQEPNPPFSTWDVQYTASTLGLAAKSLDAQTMLALASAWLFFFISIGTWSWYSLLHPSAKHQGKHKWSLGKAFKCGCAPGWIVETVGVVLLIVVFGCFIAFFTEVMAAASKQVGAGSGQTSFVLANGVFLLFAVLMTWVGFELDKFGRWLWPKMSGSWCK